ncbi:cytochrome P450 3A24-like isoform X2 [Actinia tenebrosa]|nr:cytochrome P450 3A24-like isoform X2 [Actinia tenebrosa]
MNPMLLVSDPEMIKQITVKEFNKFVNRPFAVAGGGIPPTNKSLLSLLDDDWRRLRTTITPVFSAAKMKQVVPLINSSCSTLAKVFGKAAESNSSIDVFRTYGKFTMEVIMSTAFGFESNSQTNPDDAFTPNAQKIFMASAVTKLNVIFPFLKPLMLLYFGLGGGTGTEAGKSVAFVVETARRMIKRRQEQGSSARKDLLELMLSAEMKDEHGNKVQKLSEDETIAQCFTFILAGYETTSNALAYTSYLLALNPDKQEKLFEEIDSVYDGKGEVTYDLVQNMEYLDMVINESLRLYPPAFRYGRICNEDCTINGVRFEKGMSVLFPVYAIQRDPEHWSDPLKFEPERFTAEAKEKRHPFSFLPFGMGPRQCIGMRFALVEAKMALTYLVKECKLEQCPETEVPLDLKASITMSPRNGIFLRIRKRY